MVGRRPITGARACVWPTAHTLHPAALSTHAFSRYKRVLGRCAPVVVPLLLVLLPHGTSVAVVLWLHTVLYYMKGAEGGHLRTLQGVLGRGRFAKTHPCLHPGTLNFQMGVKSTKNEHVALRNLRQQPQPARLFVCVLARVLPGLEVALAVAQVFDWGWQLKTRVIF